MCLAIPGKVIKVEGRKATIEYPGLQRPAMIGETGVKLGDYVMVQMGIIVKVLTADEARSTLEAWGSLKQSS
jgi:hydrogenase expression/formation protein HypC